MQTILRAILPLLAALFALMLLPGCEKTPRDHDEIAKTSTSAQKRAASVEALAANGRERELVDVTLHAADADTRRAAFGHLKIARYLADVVEKTPADSDIHREALDRLCETADEHELAKIAKKSGHSELVTRAVGKITTPGVLAGIVADRPFSVVFADRSRGGFWATKEARLAAVLKLDDQPRSRETRGNRSGRLHPA